MHEHRRAHRQVGLLDSAHARVTGPRNLRGALSPGHMSPRVDQGSLERDTQAGTHRTASSVKQIFPAGGLSPVEEPALGGGLVIVANGSLSAGGPLPAPCVHTCGISHQHLLRPPPPPPGSTGLCVTVCPIGSVAAQGQPNGQTQASQTSQTQGLGAKWQGWVGGSGVWMGGGPHNAFLSTLQRQCSLGVTLPLLATLRLRAWTDLQHEGLRKDSRKNFLPGKGVGQVGVRTVPAAKRGTWRERSLVHVGAASGTRPPGAWIICLPGAAL